MVRYPFDLLRAVSPSTWLRTLRFSKGEVEPLTTNGKSDTYGLSHPFALRYRRVNGTFYETIKQVIHLLFGSRLNPPLSGSRIFLRELSHGQRGNTWYVNTMKSVLNQVSAASR
jgi:hypothetical protein